MLLDVCKDQSSGGKTLQGSVMNTKFMMEFTHSRNEMSRCVISFPSFSQRDKTTQTNFFAEAHNVQFSNFESCKPSIWPQQPLTPWPSPSSDHWSLFNMQKPLNLWARQVMSPKRGWFAINALPQKAEFTIVNCQRWISVFSWKRFPRNLCWKSMQSSIPTIGWTCYKW